MTNFLRNWGLAVFWCVVIALESTSLASSANTGGLLARLLTFFFGPISPATLASVNHVLRKTGHFGGYALLSHGWWRGLSRTLDTGCWPRAGVAVLLTAAVASLDEWHQGLLPSRTASPWDVLLDASGALAMQAILLTICYLRQRAPRFGKRTTSVMP